MTMFHVILHQHTYSFKTHLVKFHFVFDSLSMPEAPAKYIEEFQSRIERLLPRFGPGEEILCLIVIPCTSTSHDIARLPSTSHDRPQHRTTSHNIARHRNRSQWQWRSPFPYAPPILNPLPCRSIVYAIPMLMPPPPPL